MIQDMLIFYEIVKQQGFSNAANKLGVSKAHVSKRLASLEEALGVKLASRSTRQMTLTEAGKHFYNRCHLIADEMEQAINEVHGLQSSPKGELKISAPPAFAKHLLEPITTQFLSSYPDISIKLDLSSEIVDIIHEGYDLVLRSTTLEDSNLIYKKVRDYKSYFVASNKYIHKFGQPQKAKDLLQQNICHNNNTTREITVGNSKITLPTPRITCGSLDYIQQCVESGKFIGILPEFMINPKSMIILFKQQAVMSSPLYIMYPHRKLPLKTGLFVDLLIDKLGV